MTLQEQNALAIYVIAARDAADALDMILECEDLEVLDLLYAMLTHKGTGNTDTILNEILTGPVKNRADELRNSRRK